MMIMSVVVTDAEASLNIVPTVWNMPQINDCPAVPTSFWRASAASRGRSWLEEGQGTPWASCGGSQPSTRLGGVCRRRMLKLNLSGCAKLRASTDKYAQRVLAERMDSSVPLSWQPEEFSSKNCRHIVRTLPCASCRIALSAASFGFDTRLWQLFHTGIRTRSHRRRHVTARLRPYITAVIFHIEGHHLTLVVRQVGGVLTSGCVNVPVFMDASFWGPPSWDLTQLCLVFMLVLLRLHLPHLLNFAKVPKWIWGRTSKWSRLIPMLPSNWRFSDPYILYPGSSRSVVSSRILIAEGPSECHLSPGPLLKKRTHEFESYRVSVF